MTYSAAAVTDVEKSPVQEENKSPNKKPEGDNLE